MATVLSLAGRPLCFEIASFKSGYHALLCISQIHISNRDTTISGNIEQSLKNEQTTCALAAKALSDSLAAKELDGMRSSFDNDDINLTKCPKSASFQSGQDVQKFQVHPIDQTKQALMGTCLDDK